MAADLAAPLKSLFTAEGAEHAETHRIGSPSYLASSWSFGRLLSRLVLPMVDTTGSIWMLDNVDK